MIVIIMGVSGSGKTTIGKLLAREIGLPFHDADDYHPEKNRIKMKNGEPLDDADRLPWLKTLSESIQIWQAQGGAVLACSALKESYRKLLAKKVEIKWVYLAGIKVEIADRLRNRMDHFFDPNLLDSQFEILEEPDYGLRVDISQNKKEILNLLTKEFI